MDFTQIEGIDYISKKHLKISIDNGVIQQIDFLPDLNKDDLPYIAPGLIDIQVNGFLGVDFNSPEILVPEIKSLALSLAKEGITTFYPTLVTNSIENIDNEITSIVNACSEYPEVNEFIGGIHLEGPFISRGIETRGAHNEKYIRAPVWELIQRWQSIAGGKIKIITLSPEWPGSNEFIEKCVKNNILVAIGHTSATPGQIKEAIKAGATLSTHLGNGSHLNIPRKNNYFWEQLTNDNIRASMIADGFHVDDSLIKVMLRVKLENLILISDCTRFSKLQPGTYPSIIGEEVVLDTNGRLFMKNEPRLMAGSSKSLLYGINYLIKKKLASLPQAWEMASVRPAKLLKLQASKGIIEKAPADLTLFTLSEDEIKILKTIKKGKEIYTKTEFVQP